MKTFHYAVCLTMFIACAGLLRANDCDPCEAVDTCSSNGNGKAIEMEFTYTGGVFGNVRGGDRRGSTYMGLAELGFTGDSEKLGLWKNGTFFVSGFFSHGPGITRFVGDYQDPVNFAYEVPAQLCEYWYKHLFFQDRLSVRAGKADSSSTFFFLDSQDYFINSGFTNLNTPHIPADPENAWGIVSELQLQRDAVLKFGIHDEDVDANRYDFPTFKKPCYVVQLEKRYSLFGNLPGFAFIGGWYDTEELVQYFTDEDIKGNYGFSAGVDQMIWRKYPNKRNGNTQGINFFLRYQADKKDRNETYRNVDYGLAYRGFFDSRPDDVVGIGSSMVRFSPGYQEYANDGDGIPYSSETALECFYRMQVTERLMVQPDFQYIWRPGGEFPHATVLGLAFQVAF